MPEAGHEDVAPKEPLINAHFQTFGRTMRGRTIAVGRDWGAVGEAELCFLAK